MRDPDAVYRKYQRMLGKVVTLADGRRGQVTGFAEDAMHIVYAPPLPHGPVLQVKVEGKDGWSWVSMAEAA